MNEEIKKLYEEMRKAHVSFMETVDKKLEEVRSNGSPSSDTIEKIEKINAELTELRKKHDDLVAAGQRPEFEQSGEGAQDPASEVRKSAFIKAMRFGFGDKARAMMTPEEVRALSPASDAGGDFLVPDDFESEVIMNAYDEGEIRALSQVRPTGRDAVMMPSLKKPTVAWGVANVAISEQDLTAGSERIEVNDLKALVLIHQNTLDDPEADVWSELIDAFSMAISEAEDDAFAAGNGVQRPQGIIANSGILANYTPTGVAAAISDSTHNGVDALIAMLHALKKTYRRNATWAMNSTTEGAVRQLKDSNGQYLWQPPVQAGGAPTLLGRPLANPEGLPDIAANAYPIVLGDFGKGYKIRDRKGMTVQRLVERYAEYSHVGFLVTKRVGAKPTLPEAFRVLKVATS